MPSNGRPLEDEVEEEEEDYVCSFCTTYLIKYSKFLL
jgi:hypothetical protein